MQMQNRSSQQNQQAINVIIDRSNAGSTNWVPAVLQNTFNTPQQRHNQGHDKISIPSGGPVHAMQDTYNI